jgi:hypothetical protein
MGRPQEVGLLTAPLSLLRAPISVSLRVAEFGLSTAAEAARIGKELLGPEREAPPDVSEDRAPAEPDHATPNGGEPTVVTPETGYIAPEPREAADAPPPVPDELIPDHVDEDPVLVAEAAEEGAEEGAGAELTIEPPWAGYDQMTAADIEDRLAAATAAEAAAVELYESSHKNRSSVTDAAARALAR